MQVRLGTALVLGLAVAWSPARAEDIKSGPTDRIGGPFDVKAITGANKGKTLCYIWKYTGERRPAVVLIFSHSADDSLASLVKAIDAVQKNNEKLWTVVVGVSGVAAADFEKLQETQKLTTPLTIAVDEDGPEAYKLNKEAGVTVLIYQRGGKISKSFAFKDTKAAAGKAKEIATAAEEALK
jgi:hypothetical protein